MLRALLSRTTQRSLSNTASTTISQGTRDALRALSLEPRLEATVELKTRVYAVKENDILITKRIKDLALGDVIQMDRIYEVKSPQFLLQGSPLVAPEYISVEGVVIEHPVSRTQTLLRHGRKIKRKRLEIGAEGLTSILIRKIQVTVPPVSAS
jgi:hypothetical protein